MLCMSSSDKEPEDEYDPIPFSLKWRMHFGKRDIDPHSGTSIIRLGSNKLVQTHCWNTEYQALKVIDRHTAVPTYKVIGIYNRPEGKLVEYEAIPGKPLSTQWASLPPDKRNRIVADLGRYVEQLRRMEPPKHYVIGDATLGAAYDHRFGGTGKIGPFYTLEAFHRFIRRGHAVKDFTEPEVAACHSRSEAGAEPYSLKFTHAQLCPANILIDEAGRVSAVVGWQSSGWFPEYWEYTQMHHATGPEFEDWLEMMRKVVPRYDVELRADDVLRRRYSVKEYDRPESVRPPSPTASELEREQREIDDKNTEDTSG